jgi:hypothetical protein
MSIYTILGCLFIAMPFLFLTFWMYDQYGIKMVVRVWGTFFLVLISIAAGVILLQMGGVLK